MSGILALHHLDSRQVDPTDVQDMASLLQRRGPDGTGLWHEGPVGLGHTLLATTPELAFERQPVVDHASGCAITADVRLDNRDELLATLRLADGTDSIGDAGLILAAYLKWGDACAERLLGDFAFALWDPRARRLFCARDHMGMRPFYYHHTPGKLLAVASEPRAILVLERVPYRINEGRIADYLVNELEGIDKTSTFFEEVFRLPPAHTLVATDQGVSIRRYWTLEPGDELHLPSHEAYAEAFLEVFTEAVRCRLRSVGPVGAMLSGGMDSGSVVAVGRNLLAAEGHGPLRTYSAVGPDPATCVETRTIHAALTMDGLAPTLVRHDRLEELMPELDLLTWSLDEPFDDHMTLVRAVYLAAHRDGLKVVLDGVAGDTVLADGGYLMRLIRAGRWIKAYREAQGQNRFYGGAYPAWREFVRNARSALTPNKVRLALRRHTQHFRMRLRVTRRVRESHIRPSFADQVDLAARLRRLGSHALPNPHARIGVVRANVIDHPYLLVGRERYDRVGSAVGIEPRDPFMDRRVIGLCLRLPGHQAMRDGWPKAILRHAMSALLPPEVVWRAGKQHLGWAFTAALERAPETRCRQNPPRDADDARAYVARDRVAAVDGGSSAVVGVTRSDDRHWEIAHLAAWVRAFRDRPQPVGTPLRTMRQGGHTRSASEQAP